MFVRVALSAGREILLNLAHVVSIEDRGEWRHVFLMGETRDDVRPSMLVSEPFDALAAAAPWMLRAKGVGPGGGSVPTLVNMTHVAMAEGLDEGTLLHVAAPSGEKILVDMTVGKVMACAGPMARAA